MRSVAAASRAAEKDRQRSLRAAHKANSQIDQLVDRIDNEIGGDLEKLRKIEKKIIENPLSAGGVSFDEIGEDWQFKEIADDTGALTWSFRLKFSSDNGGTNQSVENGGRTYSLAAIAATRWGVYAAFRMTATSSRRPAKLFNKRDRTANKVFLKCDGTLYRAIEGQLDVEIPVSSSQTVLVAFPLPRGTPTEISVEFVLKDESRSMALHLSDREIFATASNEMSLVDRLRGQFEAKGDTVKTQAAEAKAQIERRSKTGAGTLWIVVIVVVMLLIYLSSR
jgi:hypothetical protein